MRPAPNTLCIPSQEMLHVVVNGIHQEPTFLLCNQEHCHFRSPYRQPTLDHIRNDRPRI